VGHTIQPIMVGPYLIKTNASLFNTTTSYYSTIVRDPNSTIFTLVYDRKKGSKIKRDQKVLRHPLATQKLYALQYSILFLLVSNHLLWAKVC